MHHRPNHADQPDDVDRLFARLDRVSVPEDLTARVLAHTVARTPARSVLAWPWLVAGLGALTLLTMTGYLLGANLAASNGLDVLEALASDLGLLATAPGDVVAALGEVMPWGLVALAGTSAALLTWAAGRVVSRSPAALRGRQPA
jgi:hypothetical protein